MSTFHNPRDINALTKTRLQIAGAVIALMSSAVIIVMALFDIQINPLQALQALFGV